MNDLPRYDTILAGTDFTPLSRAAVVAAAELSQLLESKRVHILHVHANQRIPLSVAPELLLKFERQAIADAKAHLDRIELPGTKAEVVREVRVGRVVQELIETARRSEAGLIVLATHGRSGVGRLVLGSVANAVIRGAPCPVYVVGEERAAHPRLKRILAAVDLSASSSEVLAHAAAFALRVGAKLEVASFYEFPMVVAGDGLAAAASLPVELLMSPDQHRRALAEFVERAKLPAGLEVNIETSVGSPVPALLEAAKSGRVDLIVVGASGHGAFERITFGSTATKLVAHAECPVLVVPTKL